MENTKDTNDWVAANLALPGAPIEEFKQNNITPENTTLKDKDFYKGTKTIQETFTNPENGKFDDDKYNQFYNSMLFTYNEYANQDAVGKADKDFDYAPFDMFAPQNAKRVQDLYKIEKVRNPFKTKVGIEDFNYKSKPALSLEEIAQDNNVRDHLTGKVLDWTPNDDSATGIFDFLKRPTLVVGQYDEDGEHYDEFEGRKIKHRKGDYKLDADGKPYFETLGDREVYNREVLNWSDTLTKEGTWLNKYDFMDSDGLDKSHIGSVMKMAAKVTPLFIPGVGEIYAAGILGVDLMNVVPILLKAGIGSVIGDRDTDKDYWKTMNKVQGVGKTLSANSVSDYAKTSTFSFENISSMLGDVFTQLYTQRAIASIPKYIGMNKASVEPLKEVAEHFDDATIAKIFEGSLTTGERHMILEKVPEAANYIDRAVKSAKLSRALATTYMSATSAAGVADQAKAIGLDERDTGLLYLGTSLGFFGMMTSLPIGEWALKGIGLEETGLLVNRGIKDAAQPFVEDLKKLGSTMVKTPRDFQKIFKIGKAIGDAVGKKLSHVDGYLGAMASEGTEEVTEQVMQDSITNIYNGLASLGITSTQDPKKQFTYGDTSDIVANYAMNFFGGVAGGAMFRFHDQIANGSRENDESTKDIYWLIRNGYKDKLDAATNKLIQKGYFGSTTLTAEQVDIDLPGAGRKTVMRPKRDGDLSQNEVIGRTMLGLFNNVQNQIFQEGIQPDSALTRVLDARYDLIVKDLKVNSSLYEDHTALVNDILGLNNDIAKALAVPADLNSPESTVLATAESVNAMQIKLAEKREALKLITSGEAFPSYQSQALFNMSQVLNGAFGNTSADDLAWNKYKKHYRGLNETEKKDIDEEYVAWKAANKKDALKSGYRTFNFLNEKFSPRLAELAKYAEQRKGHYTLVDELGNKNKFNLSANTLAEISKSKSYLGKTLTVSEALNDAIKGKKDVNSILKAVDDIMGFVTNPSIDRLDKNFTNEMRDVFDGLTLNDLIGENASLFDTLSEDENFNEEGLPGTDYDLLSIDDLLNENLTSVFNKLDAAKLHNKDNQRALNTITKITSYILGNPNVNLMNSKKAEFEQAVHGRTINTLNELLDQFDFLQNGTKSTITQLLTNEFEALGKVNDINDYQIYNPNTIENLESAKVLLERLQALVIASTEYDHKKHGISGYNSIINNTFKGSQLGIITQEQATPLLKEIQQINAKIELFLTLSAFNKESKVKNNIASGINMETLFFGHLQEGSFRNMLDSLKIEEEEFITPDMAKSIEDAKTIKRSLEIKQSKEGELPSSDEEVFQFEAERLKINKVFFERVKELNLKYGEDKIHELLFNNTLAKQLFPVAQMSHATPTNFNTTTTQIQPLDLFIWWNTMVTEDPAEFYTELRGDETEPGKYDGIETSKYVPFYAQEYSAKIILSFLDNKSWINKSLNYLGGVDTEGAAITGTFMGKLHETFKNLVFVNGVPGAGKSSAVGYTVAKILKKRGKTFWTAGAYDTQAKQLETLLENPTANVSFNKTRLLAQFLIPEAVTEITNSNASCLGKGSMTDIVTKLAENKLIKLNRVVEKQEGKEYEKLKVGEIKPEAFLEINRSTLPAAIFLDEITHLSMIELEALRQSLIRLGEDAPLIIGLGDSLQNGFRIAGEDHNMDMFRTWNTPKLAGSLRTSNDLKNTNLINTVARYSMITEAYDKVFTEQSVDYAAVKANIESMHNPDDESTWYKLGHHTNEMGIVFGEKVSNALGVSKDLKNILDNTIGTVGFITDNNTSENEILSGLTPSQKSRLDIKSITDVQGLEYDHIVIDVDWNALAQDTPMGPLNFISNVYTLTTRSRVGSLILDRNFSTNNYLVVKSQEANQVIDVTLDKEILKKFKEKRVEDVTKLANFFEGTTSVTPKIKSKDVTPAILPVSATESFAQEIKRMDEEIEAAEAGNSSTNRQMPTLDLAQKNTHLMTYPYYERVGVPGEDALIFGLEDGEKPDLKFLMDIKNSVFYGAGEDKIMEILKNKGIDNIDSLKVVVRASMYNPVTDTDNSKVVSGKRDADQELTTKDVFLRTALRIERSDNTGKLSPFYITLGVFSSPKSTSKYDYKNDAKLSDVLKDVTAKAELALKTSPSVDLTINHSNPLELLKYTTNIQLDYLENPISFKDFKEDLSRSAVVSPIHIFTGHNSAVAGSPSQNQRLNEWIKKGNNSAKERSLAGRAVVFVSFDNNLKSSELADKFAEEIMTNSPNPRVKAVMLNSKGTDPKIWFENAWNTLADAKKKPTERVAMGTLASQHMATFMASTIKMMADSSKYTGKTEIIKTIAKTIIERLGTGEGNMNILEIDRNAEEAFRCKVKAYTDDKIKNSEEYLASAAAGYLKLKPNQRISAFNFNHTYRLLVGMGIAMNGGLHSESAEVKQYFEPISKYTTQYGEFLEEFYSLLRKEFVHGIFSHPSYNIRGPRTNNDYAQIVENEEDDFEVTARATLPNSLLNLQLVMDNKQSLNKEQTEKSRNLSSISDYITLRQNSMSTEMIEEFIRGAGAIRNLYDVGKETSVAAIMSNIDALYDKLSKAVYTTSNLIDGINKMQWTNTEVSQKDVSNPENKIQNNGDGSFVVTGNNGKFDFEIKYNMNESIEENKMKITTNERPIPLEEVGNLIQKTTDLVNKFKMQYSDIIPEDIFANVLSALSTGTREIVPGSAMQMAFAQLSAQALTLDDEALLKTLHDYTNTKDINTCN